MATAPPTEQPFTVVRAGHTGFTVASLAAALAFWHDLLGLEILYQKSIDGSAIVGVPDAKISAALLQMPGGHQIELLEYTSPDDRKLYTPRPCDVGNVHIAIEVTRMGGLISGAAPLGWHAVSGGGQGPQRFKRGDGSEWDMCYLRSGDGVTLELMEKCQS